jgi:hypothetical protein
MDEVVRRKKVWIGFLLVRGVETDAGDMCQHFCSHRDENVLTDGSVS